LVMKQNRASISKARTKKTAIALPMSIPQNIYSNSSGYELIG
jgi:hypothetical protein